MQDDDDDTSNLRDLLCSPSDYSWGALDTDPISVAEDHFKATHRTHRWLCNGHVLRLDAPEDAIGNLAIFKFAWRHSQPVVMGGVGGWLEAPLWRPPTFAELPDHGLDPANPEATSAVTNGQTLKKFFDGFDEVKRRPLGDNGEPLCLKLRDNWPAQEDHFLELLPDQVKDILKNLPLPEYTDRDGILNLAARLPDSFVRLDLGPRLWGGYVKSTYPMQYNVSDSFHLCVHTGRDAREDLAKSLEATPHCDSSCVERVRGSGTAEVAALWQVFHPNHADKIKKFILDNCKTPADNKNKTTSTTTKNPLYEQTMFLKERHLEKLAEEEGIKPWVFVQHKGEGVAIPAGAPFQIRLVQAALMVQTDFVSPEHIRQAMQISHGLDKHQFDDRLQVKNLVFHACKDALSVLYNPDNKK